MSIDLAHCIKNIKKITLIDDDELIFHEQKIAYTFNDFFSNIVISLNLPESQNTHPLSNNIDHPSLITIVKWRHHLSVAITVLHENQERFTFMSGSQLPKKLFFFASIKTI